MEHPESDSPGLSRRGLLRATSGGVAAVALIGLGTETAAAAPVSGLPSGGGRLHEGDPHAATFRTRPSWPATGGATGTAKIRVLPNDRAKFLAGARFDLRVEAAGVDPQSARIDIAVHGPNGPAGILVGQPERTSTAADRLEITYRDLTYPRRGDYTVRVTVKSGGSTSRNSVTHAVVVANSRGRRAKNVIFFLGDGMGTPAITTARIMSKGLTEGKYNGLLNMDRMEYRGLVSTSGYDALATDSANSMSAYMCGHKSSVNAMGVYESTEPDAAKQPRVETMAELVKRARKMSVGVVTTAEIQDATPAAVWAHTRRRSEYVNIMDQALKPAQRPDVLLGGGLASLLPQGTAGSRRTDSRNLVDEFKALGFSHAQTRAELAAAMKGSPSKLLGLFHTGNLNVYLDRQHAKDPAVLGQWTDQPNLMEMTSAALRVLEKNRNGFFLMVEGASIDKMEHPLDGPRVGYDAIEFDKAIGVAVDWAKRRDDTLIVVTADHNHSMSIIGTHDRSDGDGRQANGVYADADFPTYADSNGDGFPDDPNPEVQLFFGWSSHPDHGDDFQHNPTFLQPALLNSSGVAVPNPNRDPGAQVQIGNLPYAQNNCVHTVEDVNVFASGPGAQRFNAFQDNTEIFFAIMDALELDPR